MNIGKAQTQNNTYQCEYDLNMQIISHHPQHTTAIKCTKCCEIREIRSLVHEHIGILRILRNLKELYSDGAKLLTKFL
jgi:hypothetical protein